MRLRFTIIISLVFGVVFGSNPNYVPPFLSIPNNIHEGWEEKCMILEGELRTCLGEISGDYEMHKIFQTFVILSRDKTEINLERRDFKLSECLDSVNTNVTIVFSKLHDDDNYDSDASQSDSSLGSLAWLDRLL